MNVVPSSAHQAHGSRDPRAGVVAGGTAPRPLTEAYFVVRTLRLLELVAFGGRSTDEVARALRSSADGSPDAAAAV